MNAEIKYFEQLYQRASHDPEVLEKNASEYPYSSLAGLLLLYHYKKTNHPGFEKLSKKTVLHFKNANWLQFILDHTPGEKSGTAIMSPGEPEAGKNVENQAETAQVPQDAYSQSTNGVKEVIENEPLAAVDNFNVSQEATAAPPVLETGTVHAVVEEQNFEKKKSEAVEAAVGEIAFEPLHTVDYFASQGIKITEEPETTDKLGNQMKSFTAWLKSMKKLHPSKLAEQDMATENQIQNAAEESNINTEILTEAMAEVLIKQDKREKAIEMYNKLSLINPSKRAYFAAKIESIKSS